MCTHTLMLSRMTTGAARSCNSRPTDYIPRQAGRTVCTRIYRKTNTIEWVTLLELHFQYISDIRWQIIKLVKVDKQDIKSHQRYKRGVGQDGHLKVKVVTGSSGINRCQPLEGSYPETQGQKSAELQWFQSKLPGFACRIWPSHFPWWSLSRSLFQGFYLILLWINMRGKSAGIRSLQISFSLFLPPTFPSYLKIIWNDLFLQRLTAKMFHLLSFPVFPFHCCPVL